MSVSTQLAVLEDTWRISDNLFSCDVTPANGLSRPISLRNPFVFYLGHLPSFTWNTLRPLFDLPQLHPTYDDLFSRGVDPDVEDPTTCHEHPPPPAEWPSWNDVVQYKNDVRAAVRVALAQRSDDDAQLANVLTLVAEHEAMHVETLYYMLAQNQRPTRACCERLPTKPQVSPDVQTSPKIHWVDVPAGVVRLGQPSKDSFRWDNEKDTATASVASFRISHNAVSVADFLCFIRAGGYYRQELWEDDDWKWILREGMQHPASWSCSGNGALKSNFQVLTGIGPGRTSQSPEDLTQMSQWPASVSLAEARAYAKWCGAKPPSEAQWLLAAYGAEGAAQEEGKVNIMTGKPHSVGKGRVAACGAIGLVGNGWELTTSLFKEFRGFQPTPQYRAYSADFFDGKHFVLKGGSWATHEVITRPSFRNFYQARYPFVFSKFRLVVPVQYDGSHGGGSHQTGE